MMSANRERFIMKVPFWIRLTLNSLVLLFLTFAFQSLEWEIGQEQQLLQGLRRVKIGLKIGQEKLDQKVLFLNTTYAKSLIPKYDESGYLEIGTESITDREKLTVLAKALQGSGFDLLLMDIYFDVETEHDANFQHAIDSISPVLVVNHLNEEKKPDDLVLNVEYGLADIITLGGYFHKYRFEEYGEKSIAIKAYEILHGETYHKSFLAGRLGSQRIYNTIVLNNRITQVDIFSKKYSFVELNEFLELNDENIRELAKDRIIVVGDFYNDTVDSIDGAIAGSLLLLNAYLALKHGDADVSIGYIVFLLMMYLMISYVILRSGIIENWRVFKWLTKYVKPLKPVFIFTMFFVTTCLSFFLFHKLISVFFLTIYLSIISFISRKFFVSSSLNKPGNV